MADTSNEDIERWKRRDVKREILCRSKIESADTSDEDRRDREQLLRNIEIIRTFESQLETIQRHPKQLRTVRESVDFRSSLHSLVHLLKFSEISMDLQSKYLKMRNTLVEDGFEKLSEPLTDVWRERQSMFIEIAKSEDMVARMTNILDRARVLGLGTCIEAAKQARQLDSEILLFTGELYKLAAAVGRADWLRLLISVVGNLDKRNKVYPAWAELEDMRVVRVEDKERSEFKFLGVLHAISSCYLPEHAAYSCEFYKFHSRYLDEELRNLALYVKARCTDEAMHNYASCLAANDVELCNILLRNIEMVHARPDVLRDFSPRMYRACLSTGSYYLADEWMTLGFRDAGDKRELVDILHGTITSLRKVKQLPTERIQLNGEHEGVGAQTLYKLPEPKEQLNKSLSEQPWWVEEFGNRIKGILPIGPTEPSTGQTCSSTADTVVLSTSRYDSMILRRSACDSQKNEGENSTMLTDNQDASWIFMHNDKIPDYDIYSINFSVPDLQVENLIELIWNSREGEELKRKTNIRKDIPYHCRVLSYDLSNNEWVITSDFCRVTGVLSVDQKGSSCEPLIGECGIVYPGVTDFYVFKVHKHPFDHSLRDYLSEIRAQCTASYYADKFSNLTGDRFGRLKMLNIDCLLLFADVNRETIIDIMTREPRIEIVEKYKSVIKFDKFTNNTSWKNRGVNTALLEAFTHFSYHDSDGVLMVADLQGWVLCASEKIIYVLTDPVIHCPKRTVRFGATNREEEGIMLFFNKVHPECNDICRELHLKRPPEFENT